MRSRFLMPCIFLSLCAPVFVAAQTTKSAPPLRAVSRTLYSDKTELFAEFRPLIVGQATRLTAHLTKVGDRFQAYTEAKVKLTLTVGDAVLQSGTDAPERPGVFRIMVTPSKAGMGHMAIEITS